MKLKLVLLIVSVGTLAASPSLSQQKKLDVSYDNRSLLSVLDDLTTRSGHQILVYKEIIPKSAIVTISRNNATIEEILNEILPAHGLTYTIRDEVIVVSPAKVQSSGKQVSQPVVVNGVVRDTDGKPIPGATVILKSTPTVGTVTDASGQFTIRMGRAEDATLVISFIGKNKTEFRYTGQKEVFITLEDDTAAIDEVVVTGIFTKARESYTGAVTTITDKEIQMFRGQNLIQTLRNIDPAINILENNLAGSNPNVMPEITIRGSSSLPQSVEDVNRGQKYSYNTPLIIMDGFEISLQKLMDYNDDEIQSINILKDAAATAIYGSRGANGVIVIISKEPNPGSLRITAKVSVDFEIPDLSSYNLMSASEKLQLELDHGFYDSDKPSTDMRLKESYYQRYRDMLEGTDTYWLSQPLRTGITQRYNIRLEGGRQEFRWGVTTAYNRLNGAMKNSYRDTFTGQILLQYSYKNVIFRNQTEVGLNKGVNSNYGAFSDYSTLNPYFKPYDQNGILVKNFNDSGGSEPLPNPLYNASLNSVSETGYTQIINNFSIDWNIVKGLTLRGRLGVSRQLDTGDRFIPPGNTRFDKTDPMEKGIYTYNSGQGNNYDGSITLGYSQSFNEKHQFYAGLHLSLLQRESYTYTFEGVGYLNDKLNTIGSALSYPEGKPSESESFTRSVGFTSNINYTFDNRYYADASLRMDGSSQFGSNHRFAPFWSVGLGWNLHREDFLKDNEVIDNLRLKASYGQTGSLQFSAYQALRTFIYHKDDRYGAWTGAYLQGLGNDDLKWQATDQFNIGTEVGAFRNLITISFDYYIKKTSNLLSNIDIPLSTGFKSYKANIGEVKNTGFETAVGAYLIRNTEKKITLMFNAKMAYNKNRITKLSEDIKRQSEAYMKQNRDYSTLYYEGYADNSLFVVRSLGIDPSTGREVFMDREGNVMYDWNASEKIYAGVTNPTYRGNFSTMFRYKDLTLNFSFAYHWGGVVYNSTLLEKVEMLRSEIMGRNVDKRVLTERWQKPGDVARYKRIPAADETDIATRGSTRFVMKDRVLQLQTASLEYRLDTEWLRKAGVSSARIGANMSDLIYMSTVKRERGLSYPFARRAGFNVSLIF